MKISELNEGMQNIELIATIDYLPPNYDKTWGIVFVKDDSKDIKMIFVGDNIKKAKVGKKIKIHNGYVTNVRGQLQLNTTKEEDIEFLDE